MPYLNPSLITPIGDIVWVLSLGLMFALIRRIIREVINDDSKPN